MATRKPAPKAKPRPKKEPEAKGLAAFFDANLFLPELQASSKAEVFEELVGPLASSLGEHNRQTLLSMLHHREVLGTTGIGKGVAIPHGRTLLTRRIRIAFGRSPSGIDYGARDGEPVHLIFLVIAPFQDRGNLYLPTLGKLVEFVKEKENRDKLLAVDTYEDLVQILSAVG